ncbi:MAG: hypothetical protein ACE5JS_03285 [Nitrospinota bacterium]
MGRTVYPFSQVLEEEERALGQYRRALRKEDQEAFDHLFASAKHHVAPSVYAGHPWPMDLILLSALIEQQKSIDKLLLLQAEVEHLRNEVASLRQEVNRLGAHGDG